MDITANRATRIVAISLITTVVLQIAYMVFLGGPKPLEEGAALTNADVVRYFDTRGPEITLVWTMEAIAFLCIAVGSFVAVARGVSNTTAWTALALAGLFNIVQIGFGLAVFEPAARAGGDSTGLFFTVVSGAFFFYFAAKVLVGVAGVMFGMRLMGSVSTGMRALAGVTALTGLLAIGTGIAAMALGNPMLLYAGAAGTVATLFVAIAAGKASMSS